MTDLRTLLSKGLRPGVYRLRLELTADQVRRSVTDAGWNFVLLDTTGVPIEQTARAVRDWLAERA